MRLAVIGATGKLGKAVIAQAEKDERFTLAAALSSREQQMEEPVDVAIDFSCPTGTLRALTLGVPLVIGTTGLDDATMMAIEAAAKNVPILVSPNFSLGIGLLLALLPQIKGAAISIKETHREGKRDLPGGTARHLASILPGEVPITSERIGDNKGEHEVTFAFEGETLIFTHKAHDRTPYAKGALEAAIFVASAPPGLYSLDREKMLNSL
jgi:4-hydroxy-tetrahydrodipicolinate reductase